ncbi:MAG: DNA alkylation repair protein [Candidatus Aminicenantes bacterium]|nr:DNA alkylation repair protein [Candidatus Aminicenantes bacterium]
MKNKTVNLSIKRIKKRVVNFLKEKADREKARSVQRFFPEPISCFGVRLPEVRKFCRYLCRETGPSLSEGIIISLTEYLLAEKELESRMAGLFLLSERANELKPEVLNVFERWLSQGYLDNWALLDTFSLEIISPVLLNYPEILETIKAWTTSESIYFKRAGLVALIKQVRKNGQARLLLEIVRQAMNRPPVTEELVAKAAGWLLREIGKKAPAELERFLVKYGGSFPRVTIRYAVEKFAPEKRKYLLSITKN